MRVILPQITLITQRGMQQAALSRRERQVEANVIVAVCCSYCCFVVLGFVCDNLRDLRENRPFTCKGRARNEQGKSKERARNERACSLTALLHKHELHDSTMRQLSFVCEIMQLAAFPLRNQRNLRENWPFTCKGRARNE